MHADTLIQIIEAIGLLLWIVAFGTVVDVARSLREIVRMMRADRQASG